MSEVENFRLGKEEKRDFQNKIKDKDKVFVLFFAAWCPYSQIFLPIFQEYSKKHSKDCLYVTIDDYPEICDKYSIKYYPTVILFKKGKVEKRLDSKLGFGLNKKQFRDFIEN